MPALYRHGGVIVDTSTNPDIIATILVIDNEELCPETDIIADNMPESIPLVDSGVIVDTE